MSNKMLMSRKWAMPNHNTFDFKRIMELIEKYISPCFIDPFARNSCFNDKCVFTNDLNPDARTTHNMEALEFLTSLELFGPIFDGILFDPPYSNRQISEVYQNVGRKVHIEDTQSSFYSNRKKAASKLIKKNGIVICFGWNSNGFGKTLGYEMIEILMVAHGGAHYDTICTVERKL